MAKFKREPIDDLPTGAPIDDEPKPTAAAAEVAPAETAATVPGRQTVAPQCPYHPEKTAISYHSNPWLTYYKCPVEGCVFRVKISRPQRPGQPPAAAEEDFSAR